MTSHDQLAKSLIQTFFPEFLHLTAPASAERLRLDGAVFLDKQSFTDWPTGDRREMDLLVEVPVRTDGRRLLIHIEIESRARPGMDRRLWGYYMQLRLRHDLPVLPVLVNLRGGRPGIRLEQLEEGFEGQATTTFRYRVWGLSGCLAEEYLTRPEPLAWAFAAVMRSGRWSPAELKVECLRRIAEACLPALHEHLLANWVETYLQLTGRDAAEFERLRHLATNREVRAMQMTWSEKLEAKGRAEGVRNMREVVLELLGQRFGSVPAKVKRKVEKIDSMDRLTEMAKQVWRVHSLDEMGLS